MLSELSNLIDQNKNKEWRNIQYDIAQNWISFTHTSHFPSVHL